MERLTVNDSRRDFPWETNTENGCYDIYSENHLVDLIERLKSIEDILGPTYDLSRLKELVEADREGKIEILPAPIGGTVYQIRKMSDRDAKKNGVPMKVVGEKYKRKVPQYNPLVIAEVRYHHYLDRLLGKEVFVTREAAEKALEAQKC